MNEYKTGHLVKVIKIENSIRIDGIPRLENDIIGKLGLISFCYGIYSGFDIEFKFKGSKFKYSRFFYESEIEILSDEPVNNMFNSFCFWCKGRTKRVKIFNEVVWYCPKCLR